MSLAALLSDSKGLSNFSGNNDTCLQVRNSQLATTALAGFVGGVSAGNVNTAVDARYTKVTSGSAPNLLKASASTTAMGADLDVNFSLIVNDNREPRYFLPGPADNLKLGLYEANIKASGSLGDLTWGKKLSNYGSMAKECGVTPGAGATASEPTLAFNYTVPELTPGLSINLGLENLPSDNVSSISKFTTEPVALTNVTAMRMPLITSKISYDLSPMLGSYVDKLKLNLETLDGQAFGERVGSDDDAAEAVVTRFTSAGAGFKREMKGMTYGLEADVYGFKTCLGTSKTQGLGHIHPAIGGFSATADGASTSTIKHKNTFAAVAYDLGAEYIGLPLNFEVNYGKTKPNGVRGTALTAGTIFNENANKRFSVGVPVSDDLEFDFTYDNYATKHGTNGTKNKTTVVSICGHKTF